MGVIVGLDGGGTQTRCAVSDGTHMLGSGSSSGSNIVRVGEDAARMSIHAAIKQAFHEACLEPALAEGACIGVAGIAVPRVRETVAAIIQEILPCPVAVVGDQEIAFQSAFGDSAGILVIGGTGSIAFGRSESGESARAGGHGFIISDEGSGQWIGRTAVSDCLRAWDMGSESALLPMLMKVFCCKDVGELVQVANSAPPPNFSSLLPVVLEAAESDDLTAVGVLRKAGRELGELARVVARKLNMDEKEFRVAMAGGVFEHCTLVREEFRDSLSKTNPNATVIAGVTVALLGALAIAEKQLALAGGQSRSL